ncbi:MAG: hypothetical protein ACRENE_09000 [Polyangiaceae bacterium]
MEEPRVLVEIQSAMDAVVNAEGELARLLGELHVVSRAEKTTISGALRTAFQKVRAARELVMTLEKQARA